jgi:hypothetical protein
MVTGLVVSTVTVCVVFWSMLPPLVIGPVLPVRRVIRVVLVRRANSVRVSIMVPCGMVGIVLLGRVSSVMISVVLVGSVVSVMLPARLLHVMPSGFVLRGLLLESHRAGGRRHNTEDQDDWIHLRFL